MSLADRLQGAAEGEGEQPGELRMSLSDHLEELRGRLLKCVVAVCVLAVVGLVFSRPIFAILMRPVLHALPEEARSLIYTSGIEEINVLMKVGLYAGVFLTTPVILWQLWGFVSPGLYPSRAPLRHALRLLRLAGVRGRRAVLLLRAAADDVPVPPPRRGLGGAASGGSIPRALREEEALRYLRLGDPETAGAMAGKATEELAAPGDGKAGDGAAAAPPSSVEMTARLDALGRLVDAAGGLGRGTRAAGAQDGDGEAAGGAGACARRATWSPPARRWTRRPRCSPASRPARAEQFASVWKLEKDLAAAPGPLRLANWTRPMLT